MSLLSVSVVIKTGVHRFCPPPLGVLNQTPPWLPGAMLRQLMIRFWAQRRQCPQSPFPAAVIEDDRVELVIHVGSSADDVATGRAKVEPGQLVVAVSAADPDSRSSRALCLRVDGETLPRACTHGGW